eukprot:813811-Pyramimonas_sp.AAC.1
MAKTYDWMPVPHIHRICLRTYIRYRSICKGGREFKNKGYSVDLKGYGADLKSDDVDLTGYGVDLMGYGTWILRVDLEN